MDNWHSPGWGGDAYREAAQPGCPSADLQLGPGLVGLPDHSAHRCWDDPASQASQKLRCRQLLDRLFRPFWPAYAAVWAERLIAEFGSLSCALAAGPAAQMRAIGGSREPIDLLRTVRAVMLRSLETRAFEGPVLSN